jgi:zinc/manganese transport system substrate-binding protein
MFNKVVKQSTLVLCALFAAMPAYSDVNVFACEPEWAALSKTLGGEHVSIYTATSNKQDPHHIQARPSLIAKARQADLLVCTGAELEVGWLPLLLRKSANPRIQIGQAGHFLATDSETLLGKPAVLDRSLGDIHAAGNPHIHLNPERLLRVAERLAHRLASIDSSNEMDYLQNLAVFSRQWKEKMVYWRTLASPLNGQLIVVHHDNWLYLKQWLGLTQLATLELKPGIPPTSAHLSSLVSRVRQANVYGITYANYQDDKAANWLSEKTGVPTVALDFSPAKGEGLIQWYEHLINGLLTLKN